MHLMHMVDDGWSAREDFEFSFRRGGNPREVPFFIRTPLTKDGKFLHKGEGFLNQKSRQKT